MGLLRFVPVKQLVQMQAAQCNTGLLRNGVRIQLVLEASPTTPGQTHPPDHPVILFPNLPSFRLLSQHNLPPGGGIMAQFGLHQPAQQLMNCCKCTLRHVHYSPEPALLRWPKMCSGLHSVRLDIWEQGRTLISPIFCYFTTGHFLWKYWRTSGSLSNYERFRDHFNTIRVANCWRLAKVNS